MAEQKNIFQRMSAITQEISIVAKNLNVDTGKSNYKAVGEADVLAAVKPIEAKHGVYSYPFERCIVESGEMVSQTKYGERKQLFMRVATVYRFVNVDNPDDFIDIQTYGDGVDTQDKAPGKAMTYGDKYALLKAYKIQTGDDPDQNASEDLSGVKRGKQYKAQPKQESDKTGQERTEPDRTGEPAYPTEESMVNDLLAVASKNKKVEGMISKLLESNQARDLPELAFMKPDIIKAWWQKICQR